MARLRGLGFAQLTRDHGIFEMYVDARRVADTPEERAAFPHSGTIVNALGMKDAKIDAREDAVELGDVFVVTSAVARTLGNDVMRRTLAIHRPDPAACASHLVAQATKAGCTHPHVTCAVVEREAVRWARASGAGPHDEPAAREGRGR